jgi:hypothetical protein
MLRDNIIGNQNVEKEHKEKFGVFKMENAGNLLLSWGLKLLNKVIYVCADLLSLFLVDKVSNSFHHNYVFQIWHVFLEATVVYIFLHAWNTVHDVQVAGNELRRHFYL